MPAKCIPARRRPAHSGVRETCALSRFGDTFLRHRCPRPMWPRIRERGALLHLLDPSGVLRRTWARGCRTRRARALQLTPRSQTSMARSQPRAAIGIGRMGDEAMLANRTRGTGARQEAAGLNSRGCKAADSRPVDLPCSVLLLARATGQHTTHSPPRAQTHTHRHLDSDGTWL